jgi:hypothetical protein
MGDLEVREENIQLKLKADLSLCKGRQYFFNSMELRLG